MAEGAKVRTVADIMSSPPVTATPSETIAVAAGRMREERVGSVVVVDGTRPIGILTERDLVRFGASGADGSASKVSEWMTEDPDTVAPEVEVVDAWKSLAEHGYRHIPVVSKGELVGIVSMRDLMRISQIRPVEGALQDVPKGLAGVVAAAAGLRFSVVSGGLGCVLGVALLSRLFPELDRHTAPVGGALPTTTLDPSAEAEGE